MSDVSDNFWSRDWKILWNPKRLIEFFPTKDMTYYEKLNSITRLSIYSGIVLSIYTEKLWPLYIPILTMAFTYILCKLDEYNINIHTYTTSSTEECVKPSQDNPFMNITVDEYQSNPKRPPACDYVANREETENYFDHNLYKYVNDRNNSQREFYTTPITTIPNDQDTFSKWLYGTPKTCKEDQSNCFRYNDLRQERQYVGDPLQWSQHHIE